MENTTSRRAFLAATGTITTLALAGCSAPADESSDTTDADDTTPDSAPDGPDADNYDGWMDDAQNYDETTDMTGEDSVTVMVGAGDSALAFSPAALRISPGTTVTWEWTGEGGSHNVAEENDLFESELADAEGSTFEYTFDGEETPTETPIKYVCTPHVAVGMKGVIVVADE